ncbi:glycosyltransferase family 39 protein [Chlamydiota bacterium]
MSKRKIKKKNKKEFNALQKNLTDPQFLKVTLLLIFIILGALVLRMKGFDQFHLFTFDEKLYTKMGYQLKDDFLNYSTKDTYNLMLQNDEKPPDYLKKPLFKHPPLYCQLISLSHRLHGLNQTFQDEYFAQEETLQYVIDFGYVSAVGVSMVFGLLTLVIVFFIGKIVHNSCVGLIAAFLIAIDPVHWICSQKIWMETTVTFFMTISILLFLIALDNETFFKYVGLAFGLALLTKYPAVLIGVSIFVYASFIRRDLLTKKNFWEVYLVAFIVTTPWIIWNIQVYGWSLLVSEFAIIKDVKKAVLTIRKLALTGLFIGAVFGIYFSFKHKIIHFYENNIKKISSKIAFHFRKKKLIILVIFFVSILVIIFKNPLRSYLIQLFSLQHVPRNGWEIELFRNEPWYFYIKRLTVLSPLYLLAYGGLLLYGFRDKKIVFIAINTIIIMLFFIKWRNFQCRYILPAVPLLHVMCATFIYKLHNILITIKYRNKKVFLRSVFCLILLLFLVKTIQIDFHLAFPNNTCYF